VPGATAFEYYRQGTLSLYDALESLAKPPPATPAPNTWKQRFLREKLPGLASRYRRRRSSSRCKRACAQWREWKNDLGAARLGHRDRSASEAAAVLFFRSESIVRKKILVDFAVLHDHDKVLSRVLDELDVFQRIAIDEHKIRERPLFNHTKLAGIGIDKSGECH
jgi:hypothetical protein